MPPKHERVLLLMLFFFACRFLFVVVFFLTHALAVADIDFVRRPIRSSCDNERVSA